MSVLSFLASLDLDSTAVCSEDESSKLFVKPVIHF